MSGDIDAILERGKSAIENEDLEAAKSAAEQAVRAAGEGHAGVLHLLGLTAWLDDDLEHAAGYLMQAADLGPDDPVIYLDTAELLATEGEPEEAEAVLRALLDKATFTAEQGDEARMLLAQIRLDDDDPEESLELLDQVTALEGHAYYRSTRAAVLLALGRTADAVAELQNAVEAEPKDADLRYQLGLTLHAAGDESQSREMMLEVLRMDTADRQQDADGDGDGDGPTYAQTQDLRSRFEDVLEDLPEPLLRKVAGAPITVQASATEQQVREGADPRAVVAFEGTPVSGDEDGELTRIVIMRDLLLEEIIDDEEIPDVFIDHMLVEMRRFFRIEELVVASV